MDTKIPIARLWHKKGKLEYFCIKQMLETFPDINFKWHIVLHDIQHHDEWSLKIDKLPIDITWYSTNDMLEYAKECDYIDNSLCESISNFVHFYHILIFHYLRRIYRYDYALAYEYDIIFNDSELSELKNCIETKTPFGIIEPANSNCDKALYDKLSNLFQVNLSEYDPHFNVGVNAGFQGMNLKLFDYFMNPSSFKDLIQCFDFSGIYDANGNEKMGWERTIIDTQEQSFHSLMNKINSSNFKVLNPEEYYFYPSYLDMNVLLNSKIIHYFGHTKPQQMIDMIEQKLQQYENKKTN
jgi:hypothetical protein